MSTEKDFGTGSYHRFLQGDVSALEELLGEYGDALVRFAYCYVKDSFVAEDVVQDAFVSLLMRRKRFSARDNFRAYLYKTVRNKCLDHLRFHKRKVPLTDLENVLSDSVDTEREYALKERDKKLYACLQQLPPQYAQALYLVYFEGYKAEEASAVLGRTKKQTYNLLARGKAALKEKLLQEGIVYENE